MHKMVGKKNAGRKRVREHTRFPNRLIISALSVLAIRPTDQKGLRRKHGLMSGIRVFYVTFA
jgi:hypothetical protein